MMLVNPRLAAIISGLLAQMSALIRTLRCSSRYPGGGGGLPLRTATWPAELTGWPPAAPITDIAAAAASAAVTRTADFLITAGPFPRGGTAIAHRPDHDRPMAIPCRRWGPLSSRVHSAR